MPVPYGLYDSPGKIQAALRRQERRSEALAVASGLLTNRLSDVFRPDSLQPVMTQLGVTPETLAPPTRPSAMEGLGVGFPQEEGRGFLGVRGAIEDVAGDVGRFVAPALGPLEALTTPPSEIAVEAQRGVSATRSLTGISQTLEQQAASRAFEAKVERGVLPGPVESWIGEEGLDAIEESMGPNVRREIEFLTSPVGVAAAAIFPVETTYGALAGITYAEAAKELGASEDAQTALQIYGNVVAGGGAFTAKTFGKEAVRELAEQAPVVARVVPERPPVAAVPEEAVEAAAKVALKEPLPRTPLAAARRVNDLVASKITGGIPEGQFTGPIRDLRPGAVIRGVTPTGETVEGTVAAVGARRVSIRTVDDAILPVTRESAEVITKAPSPGLVQRVGGVISATRRGVTQPGAVAPLDPAVAKFNRLMSTARPTARGVTAEQAAARAERVPRMVEALEDVEVTTREALIRGRQAQAGPLLPEGKPQFEIELPTGRGTLEEAFAPQEVENFVNLARFSPSLENVPHTRLNVIETLIGNAEKKGILQGRLPTMGEIRLLEKVYGPEFAQNLARMRPFGEKFWNGFLDFANVPRTLLASMDFSFPFRQGIFALTRHPKEFFGNLPAMIRAARDPDFAQAVTGAIRNNRRLIQTADGPRPLGELLDEADVFIADPAGIAEFSGREEQFLSAIAERVPGVQFSQRAFIVYGNKLRADIFENALRSMAGPAGRNPPTAAEIKDLGTLVNVLTGRGTLPPDLAKSLSFGFFAPRFAVSRPQLAIGTLLGQVPGARRILPVIGAPGTTARVAHLAAQELVSSVTTGVGILSLMSLAGVATVELNPLSSDYGKGKIGKTRIDFWGGARPWATLIARMVTGKRKTSDGFVVPSDLKSDMLSFGRTKLSPPGTVAIDAIEGETAIGEDFPRAPLTELRERGVPMAIQDIWEAVKQEGTKGGLIAGALAPVGVGVQTYETPSERRKRLYEEETQESWEKTADQWRIANEIADSGNEEFQEAFAPTPEILETEEMRESEASELGLFALAQGVNQGVATAGPEFVETYEDYLDRISGAIYEAVYGKDSTASPEYQVWKDIKPTRDPETFLIDWDSYFLLKDAAFDKLDPRLQNALKRHDAPGDDPTLQRVVDDFYEAREVRRGFYDIPKYSDLSAKDGEKLDEFLTSTVEEFKRRWLREVGVPLDSMTAMLMAAEESGLSEELLGMAIVLATQGITDLMVSPKRDTYLEQNQNLIGTFYPDLLEAQLSREQEVQLGTQAFEAIAAR